MRILYSLIALMFVLYGALVYLFFVPESLFLSLFKIETTYPLFTIGNENVSILVTSYLADILWSVSFVFAVQAVMCLKSQKVFLLFMCSFLGCFFELLQMLNVVKGTFDIVDMFVYPLGTAIGILLIELIQKGEKQK